jgi:putative colanic acid biosynthesis UDP-glucose lipid carrier transferase
VLRATSLDELPQFWNVVVGDMSIVGPRPHALSHDDHYRREIRRYISRHKVLPGVTGWAQINGLRGEIESPEDMARRIEFDLDYIRYWSPALDLKIILLTIPRMLRDPAAY